MRPHLLIRLLLLASPVGLPGQTSIAGEPHPLPPERPAAAIQLLGPEVCDFVGLDGEKGNWDLQDGVLTVALRDEMSGGNHLVSTFIFQDARVHAEFMLPDGWTGNSGLYFHGLYELQILNSYGANRLSWSEMGSVYRFHQPLVNAARPPRQWQTYDVQYFAPRRGADGKISTPGRVDAWLNGTAVQLGAEFGEPRSAYCTMLTLPTPYIAHARKVMDDTGKGPLILQEHLSPVSFRNIWVHPLEATGIRHEGADTPGLTIGLIGDSTVADTYGWGPALSYRLEGRAKVVNYAKNGATLQALSNRLDELLELSPTYVLVQFGHNDQQCYGLEAYERLLRSYIERIEASGAEAIVVSPVTRRSFGETGRIEPKPWNEPAKPFYATLDRYAQSAIAVAQDTGTSSIDLHALSVQQCNALGPQACSHYNAAENDRTHFSPKGADATAELVLGQLQVIAPTAFSEDK